MLSPTHPKAGLSPLLRENHHALQDIFGETIDFHETQCNVDLTKADSYRLLEQKTNQFVEQQLSRTILTIQQTYGVDSFGFGEDMYRQHAAQFNRVQTHWNDEFQKAKIIVHSDCHLRRSGIRTKSFLNEMK